MNCHISFNGARVLLRSLFCPVLVGGSVGSQHCWHLVCWRRRGAMEVTWSQRYSRQDPSGKLLCRTPVKDRRAADHRQWLFSRHLCWSTDESSGVTSAGCWGLWLLGALSCPPPLCCALRGQSRAQLGAHLLPQEVQSGLGARERAGQERCCCKKGTKRLENTR